MAYKRGMEVASRRRLTLLEMEHRAPAVPLTTSLLTLAPALFPRTSFRPPWRLPHHSHFALVVPSAFGLGLHLCGETLCCGAVGGGEAHVDVHSLSPSTFTS